MRTWLRHFVVALALIPCLLAQESPRMKSVEPGNGKVGDELTVSGENLDRKFVKELYLTDGTTDVRVEIVQQTAEAIKFKIPAKVKAGRYSLMVLTADAAPKLIEQPVKCTVEQ